MYSTNKQEKSCNTYRFSISKPQSICGLPAFHKAAQSMHFPALRPIYFNSTHSRYIVLPFTLKIDRQ